MRLMLEPTIFQADHCLVHAAMYPGIWVLLSAKSAVTASMANAREMLPLPSCQATIDELSVAFAG